jgi:two-component system NarL family sensor kinase
MAREGTGKSGRTLALPLSVEGSADLSKQWDGYTLRRAAVAAVAIGAFVAGVAASAVVVEGEVDPGVVADPSGSSIEFVAPSGLAWRFGLRPGQRVVSISRSDAPGGWRIESTDGFANYVIDQATADGALAATWPLSAGSLATGAFALLFLRARRRWVLPAGSLALLLAGPSLESSGSSILAVVDLGASALLPCLWLASRAPGRAARVTISAVAMGFLAGWAYARVSALPGVENFDWVRANVATWGTGAIVLDRVAALRSGDAMLLGTRPRPFDVAAIAVVAGGALAVVSLSALPPLAVAVAAAGAVLAIPTARRRLRPLENALLADVRAQAAAEATEEERGRLARELHDVPLQELFGVIRRLEVKPGTEAESDDLRALASHLRNVAIDLRPPVLEDLGLPAALEYLAEGTSGPGRPVVAEIADHAGIVRAQRPPEAVELAMFRIAMEAVANALAHSGAASIHVSAIVEPRRVELRIADNGAGLDPEAARAALKAKHMGLTSMRRRADAIDADFSIRAGQTGTTVEAIWRA